LNFSHGLKAGETITNSDLATIFRCSSQGGLRRSLRSNSLIIVSDHTKSIYEDRWVADDVLHYTGIGLEGDQSLAYAQNKALAESTDSGLSAYLFEVYESGRYLFRGAVALCGEPFQEIQPDINNDLRKVWVFPLQIIGLNNTYKVPGDLIAKKQHQKERLARRLSDKELFARAIHSRKHPVNRRIAATAYEPNVYVAELARRRAEGVCQLCDQPAPFTDTRGIPYLEPYHITWLEKGGEDTVENTVVLCPNCHRKMRILNLKSDRKKLSAEAQKTCCQLTFSGDSVFV
jgi:5-methylcytosine-specific restriction protein A